MAPPGGYAATETAATKVEWTIPFICFLAYTFSVTTQRFSFAIFVIPAALVALLLDNVKWRFPSVLMYLGAFLLWGMLGYTTSQFPRETWDVVVEGIKIWLIVLAFVNAVRTPAQLRFFIIFYLACFAIYPVRGALMNYITGNAAFGRVAWNGVYANPNALAALMLLPLATVAALLKGERERWVRWAAMVGFVLIVAIIMVTQSRGAFLALSAGAGLAALGHRRRLRAMVVMGVMGIAVLLLAPAPLLERLSGLRNLTSNRLDQVDPEGSAFQRWEIWRVAGDVIADHPLTGVGMGAYPKVHERYARRGDYHPTARGERDSHNTFVTILAEMGWPGLILFTLCFLMPSIHIARQRRRIREVDPEGAERIRYLQLGQLAFFIAGIWGSLGYMTYPYLHLALTILVANDAEQRAGAAVRALADGRQPLPESAPVMPVGRRSLGSQARLHAPAGRRDGSAGL